MLRPKKEHKLGVAHRRSKRQEKECAERLGASLTPRSGAGLVKGDVRKKGVMRIECKTTTKKSFSVTREMVQKIEEAALLSGGELPAIEIEFLGAGGKRESAVVVVPVYVLEMMGVRDAS